MGEEKKVREYNIKKGDRIALGHGRPRLTEEERTIRKLTRTKFQAIVDKYLGLNELELADMSGNQSVTVIERMVLSVISKAIHEGDEKKMNWFLEQLFGKLTEKTSLELSGTNGEPININYSKLSSEQLKVMLEVAEMSRSDADREH